ncbi:penicillin-binding protein 1A [Neptuniibacter sp. CAU 1671]|uniref:penicillin-binding protein 1A n=1 Tax=Neptuniibacter sp. CAU 1671 TaxID=3032593 RepID=UPI0023DAE5C1|nr:penicillin-binding protein 1A [Neptuniibacter sp. CAU 1671]MDF2181653.1 penicillin-binding protein 1A [Neptuniibacter sp. CAU 1671]
MFSLLKLLLKFFFAGLITAVIATGGVYLYFSPQLPDVQTLRDVRLQTPLRIYSSDNKLISEFGEKRRTPISYNDIPPTFVHAILAAEDSRFFEHPGIDIKGLARAAFQLASSGQIQSGGSTITMQVAKNYFLTRERTFTRKFMEILLALRIEQELSKEEILELYINKIYLGQRAYGIQAAANVYYGQNIQDLSLERLAMIAGLPKAPSAFNPISNPTRALERRNWILQRMHSLGYIEDQAYEEAVKKPVTAKYHSSDIELSAPYLAEMVRSELFEQYGEDLYTEGFKVFTTVNSELQNTANTALIKGLLEYSERHGYHGPEQQIDLQTLTEEEQQQLLKNTPAFGGLEPALVIGVDDANKTLQLLLKGGQQTQLTWDGMKWARPYKTVNYTGKAPEKPSDIVTVGGLIRILQQDDQLRLTQIPKAQAALVSLNPDNGAILSLVGGFSFSQNKFNRVTMAARQPGSNFKPFIYAAALNQGYTPATLINDAPIVFHDEKLEGNWRPENYSKQFYGPTRLRVALYKSRNLVSIRLLRAIGINTALDFLEQIGFNRDELPNNLSLSLGSADITPLQLVTGYASLANGGFKVSPYFIERVETAEGEELFKASPATVCADCMQISEQNPASSAQGQVLTDRPLAPRVIDERVAYQTYNMMQDVIRRGTGTKALVLNRQDLAGKTGTTNDQKDAWFSGFNRDVVTTVWVGFDQPTTLGRREFGGTAALPIWIDFMREALKDRPENAPVPPEGISIVKIDPVSGKLAYPGQENAEFEVFREEDVPTEMAGTPGTSNQSQTTENLF